MTFIRKLGILGGGQLGRMSAMAAARLGIEVVIFTDEPDSPAAQVVSRTIVAPYDDRAALAAFAADVDVISYEFENIPVETIRYLRTLKPVYPDDRLLDVSQDRIKEKSFLNQCGINTCGWLAVAAPGDITRTLAEWKTGQIILKTTRFGYDGKGQAKFNIGDDPAAAFDALGGGTLIAESIVDFDYEISVIAARDAFGKTVFYGPVRNEHKNHILHISEYPAPGVSDATAAEAIRLTGLLADAVDLRGVLALEMFVTRDGKILANEIAPRTHNSGHYSIDACAVSQFENHVRAVCGLPVADPAPHSHARMLNLIGDDINDIDQYLDRPGACVHLYGKREAKPGRKMGHVNFVGRG